MKGYVLLPLLCVARLCVAADSRQCARIASLPANVKAIVANQLPIIFHNQWIVSGNGVALASTDKGTTWQQILPPSIPAPSFVVGPYRDSNGDDVLFAIPRAGNLGIESTKNGVDWSTTATPIHPSFLAAAGDLWVIAGDTVGDARPDLRVSRDAGHHWAPAPALDPLLPPPSDNGWTLLSTGGRILLVDQLDLSPPPNIRRLTRVRRLSANAERWEDITPCACDTGFTPSFNYVDILAAVAAGDDLQADHGPVLLVTADAGSTWSFRPLPPRFSGALVLNGAVVVSFDEGHLFLPRFLESTDAGLSWRSVGDGLPTYPPGTVDSIGPFGRTEDSLLVVVHSSGDLYSCTLR